MRGGLWESRVHRLPCPKGGSGEVQRLPEYVSAVALDSSQTQHSVELLVVDTFAGRKAAPCCEDYLSPSSTSNVCHAKWEEG